MRLFRVVILICAAITAPVALLGYGWMLRELLNQMPWWISVPVIVAQVIAGFGVASLIDRREELRLQLGLSRLT